MDEVAKALSELTKATNSLKADLDRRHVQNVDTFAGLDVKVDRVLRGFPGGDPDKHREYHQSLIDQAQAKEKFWIDVRMKLVEKGIWAAIIFTAAAIIFYVRAKLSP